MTTAQIGRDAAGGAAAVPGARSVLRRPRRSRGARRSVPYLLALPIVAFEGVFILYPIVKGFLSSFTSSRYGERGSYTLSNFDQMGHDHVFWQVLRVTVEFTVATVVVVLAVGLGVALLTNWAFRGRGLVRGVLAMPWAVPDVPTVLTFILMMDPNFGIINRMAAWLPGVGHHNAWLTSPHLAFVAIIVITTWKGFPFYALILLSALQAIPDDLIEAAMMDGAGPLRRFRAVTLPSIQPTLALLSVLAFIFAMQQFSVIYLATGGGPGSRTTTLAVQIYNEAFQFFNYNYASAIAVVGLLLSVVATTLFVVIERRIRRSRGEAVG